MKCVLGVSVVYADYFICCGSQIAQLKSALHDVTSENAVLANEVTRLHICKPNLLITVVVTLVSD